MIVVGAKKWLQFSTVALVAAAFSGAMVGLWRSTPSPPAPVSPPEPIVCHEKAELRTLSYGTWDCEPPARIEIYATNSYDREGHSVALFKCVCGSRQAPIPAPDAFINAAIEALEPIKLKEPTLSISK
jgi:hypothetical protein